MKWIFLGVIALLVAGGVVGLLMDALVDRKHKVRRFWVALIALAVALAIVATWAEDKAEDARKNFAKPDSPVPALNATDEASTAPRSSSASSSVAGPTNVQQYNVAFSTLCNRRDTTLSFDAECRINTSIRNGTFSVGGRLERFTAEAGAGNQFANVFTFAESSCHSVHLRFAQGAEEEPKATITLRITQGSRPQVDSKIGPRELGRLDTTLDGGPWAIGVYTPTVMGGFGAQASTYINGYATCTTIDSRL